MAKSSKAAKGLPSRTGKRKSKFAQYFAHTAAKKLRHVLEHNGPDAAKAWKARQFDKGRTAGESL